MGNKTDKIIRFAAIGDCCTDDYVDLGKTFLGGTAFNCAVAARTLGVSASIISAIGTDKAGKKYLDTCTQLGIHTDYLKKIQGKTSSISIRQDKNGSPIFGAWELEVLSHFVIGPTCAQFISSHDIAHAVLFRQLTAQFENFCNIRAPGTLKSGDFAGASLHSTPVRTVRTFLHGLNIVFKSLDPSDTQSIQALRLLAQKTQKIVVVLLGKAGSIVFYKGKQCVQPAFRARVIDTTGAGDAYCTHFLLNYVRTKNIAASMAAGTQAARRVVIRYGANSY